MFLLLFQKKIFIIFGDVRLRLPSILNAFDPVRWNQSSISITSKKYFVVQIIFNLPLSSYLEQVHTHSFFVFYKKKKKLYPTGMWIPPD